MEKNDSMSEENFQSFQCCECGGAVKLLTGIGRTRELIFRFPLPFPDDVKIPTCEECGETYSTVESGKELDDVILPFLESLKNNPKIKYVIVDSYGKNTGVDAFTDPVSASRFISKNMNRSDYYVKWIEA